MCEFVDGETQNGDYVYVLWRYLWECHSHVERWGYVCVETGVCLNGETCVYMCVKKDMGIWRERQGAWGREEGCCVGVCVWRVECVGALEEEKWVFGLEGMLS